MLVNPWKMMRSKKLKLKRKTQAKNMFATFVEYLLCMKKVYLTIFQIFTKVAVLLRPQVHPVSSTHNIFPLRRASRPLNLGDMLVLLSMTNDHINHKDGTFSRPSLGCKAGVATLRRPRCRLDKGSRRWEHIYHTPSLEICHRATLKVTAERFDSLNF